VLSRQLGFVGLGRMGAGMVERITRGSDHEVVGFDVDPHAVARGRDAGALIAGSLEELVERLRPPRVAWVMLPPGPSTADTIAVLGDLMERGDLIVDGGNSKWTETRDLAEALRPRGIELVDVGTSGGIWGLRHGYCLMVGGSAAAVERLEPVLDRLAAGPDETHGCGWAHVGPSAAGHYVKMVHNAIEYGLMQAYAEGFDLFDSSDFPLDKAQIAHLWMRGSVVRSWLCELAARAFDREGGDLAGIAGYAEDSGQGRWTVEEAVAKGVPVPVIAASVNARFYSRGRGDLAHRLLAALRAEFGGHATRAQSSSS
jgi:6-phosphogluconate dehydrogenase